MKLAPLELALAYDALQRSPETEWMYQEAQAATRNQ